MPTHTFTLLIDGPDLQTEAGCDDALFGARDHIQCADFDRDAPNFAVAVGSAIRDVERAISGARVLRVEPEEFVSLAAIAERTGKSRECVRLWAEGQRGPGGFPSALRWIDARTRLWRWSDVVEWLTKNSVVVTTTPDDADVIVTINSLLEMSNHIQRLTGKDERDAVVALVRDHDELRSLLTS